MIVVKVFLNPTAQSTNTRVLERRIQWDPSIQFPFDATFNVMKHLFGRDAVVVFELE